MRLIGADGTQVGIVPIRKAKDMAVLASLDLVKIAGKAVPPVCKIMDYGKYKYELAKKEKESKKNQRITEVKEIRLSLNIDTHDFDTKVGHARRFAEGGNKVKVSLRFRGRENGRTSLGYDIMNRFALACSEFMYVEKAAKLEGKNMLMFLAPNLSSKSQNSKQKNSDKKQDKSE